MFIEWFVFSLFINWLVIVDSLTIAPLANPIRATLMDILPIASCSLILLQRIMDPITLHNTNISLGTPQGDFYLHQFATISETVGMGLLSAGRAQSCLGFAHKYHADNQATGKMAGIIKDRTVAIDVCHLLRSSLMMLSVPSSGFPPAPPPWVVP